jgi:hypothetical protein
MGIFADAICRWLYNCGHQRQKQPKAGQQSTDESAQRKTASEPRASVARALAMMSSACTSNVGFASDNGRIAALPRTGGLGQKWS